MIVHAILTLNRSRGQENKLSSEAESHVLHCPEKCDVAAGRIQDPKIASFVLFLVGIIIAESTFTETRAS